MKIVLSTFFTILIWGALYRLFFDDSKDFWKTAKENTFWFSIGLIFDTVYGGVRFLIWIALGIFGGVILGSTVYGLLYQ